MIRYHCQRPIRPDSPGRWPRLWDVRSSSVAYEATIAGDKESAHDQFLKLVGERIRAVRRQAGLKQSDLALAIGAKQPYVVAIEAGENLTLKSLARISAVLKVQPVVLLAEGELAAAMDNGLFEQVSDLARRAAQHTEELAEILREIEFVSVRTDIRRSTSDTA